MIQVKTRRITMMIQEQLKHPERKVVKFQRKVEENEDIEKDKEMGDNDDEPGAFRAYSDVELARTPTGAKVFTAPKGAVDGELDVSYAEKRFLGYDNEVKPLDDVHRTHTFGQHEANHTKDMSEENEKAYKKQFHGDIKVDATPASISRLMLLSVLIPLPRPRLLLQDERNRIKQTGKENHEPKEKVNYLRKKEKNPVETQDSCLRS